VERLLLGEVVTGPHAAVGTFMDHETTILLVCSATVDLTGRILAGRMAGVGLNHAGRAEVRRLARRVHRVALAAVLSSPLERAVRTAQAIARPQGLQVECAEALNEMDFGDWTGRTFSELERLGEWKLFLARRTRHPPPHGETIAAVQARVVDALAELAARHPGAPCALVSHPEVIKAALGHVLGMSLDHLGSLDLLPASVSVVRWRQGRGTVAALNDTGSLDRIASSSERIVA
jgi:broad specificity phosphatase PhoE